MPDLPALNYRPIHNNEALNRAYETRSDRAANVGVPADQITRSYSIHAELNRAGSTDRIHGHENFGNIQERPIGHWDRTGAYTGR
jgi:hypothetical protein